MLAVYEHAYYMSSKCNNRPLATKHAGQDCCMDAPTLRATVNGLPCVAQNRDQSTF